MTTTDRATSRAGKFFVMAVSTMMLLTILVPTQTAEASASYTPCPHYSIQDVYDDPNTDWDNDGVGNSDELYNGLNPCIVDTASFCNSGGNALCRYGHYYSDDYYYYHHKPTACESSVLAYPNGDYDGDGISNSVESRNYANPCSTPCPNPTSADLALNPNGSWDGDGISNAIEVNNGTDPCNSHDTYRLHNPCPYWTQSQRNYQAYLDWDADGIYNVNDASPCTYNAPVVYYQQPKVQTYTPARQLPHVTASTYVAPSRPTCPAGYPHYHSGNGRCYANPVGYHF